VGALAPWQPPRAIYKAGEMRGRPLSPAPLEAPWLAPGGEPSLPDEPDVEPLVQQVLGNANAASIPRFHSPALVRRLLQKSHADQSRDPGRAEGLAKKAAAIGMALFAGRSEQDGAGPALLVGCAWCLIASARRLQGQLVEADSALTSASYFLADAAGPPGRELYLRTAGLLRWEQGRLDEAAALLGAASETTESRSDRPAAGAASRAILGLLAAERGEVERAVELLAGAVPALPAERPHLPLATSAGLTLAAGLAELGQEEPARRALEAARTLLAPLKRSEEAWTRAQWLEARARLWLGEATAARRLLDVVEEKLYRERHLGEATLAALDLALAQVEAGRLDGAERLRKSPGQREELLRWGGGDVTRWAFQRLASQPAEPASLRAVVADLSRAVRRKLRFRGLRVEPPPFA
jgi:hypothetical protein